MNRKTLQKIIDELGKESPRIPYVLGVLETLIDSLPEDKVIWNPEKQSLIVSNHMQGELKNPSVTEPSELDTVAASRIDEIKKMAGDVN